MTTNLHVFMKFNTHNPHRHLSVSDNTTPQLFIKKGPFSRKSIEKVVNFIEKHEKEWLKNTDQKPLLEYKLGWLHRIGQKAQEQFNIKNISYQTSAHWNVTFAIVLPVNREGIEKTIVSKNLERKFLITRYDNNSFISDKFYSVRNSWFIDIKCLSSQCNDVHSCRINLTNLTEKIPWPDEMERKPYALFLPLEQEGRNMTISLKVTQINKVYLKTILDDIQHLPDDVVFHQSPQFTSREPKMIDAEVFKTLEESHSTSF
jgi:hypothetical protein